MRETLKLELSEAKTLLTHARTGAARFLGYEITVLAVDEARDRHDRRTLNDQIGLRVPADVIRAKCRPYLRHGKPAAWAECLHDAPFSIVTQFALVYRGVAAYYQMAFNGSLLLQEVGMEWMPGADGLEERLDSRRWGSR